MDSFNAQLTAGETAIKMYDCGVAEYAEWPRSTTGNKPCQALQVSFPAQLQGAQACRPMECLPARQDRLLWDLEAPCPSIITVVSAMPATTSVVCSTLCERKRVLLCERGRSLEEQACDIAYTRSRPVRMVCHAPAGYVHSRALQRFLYFVPLYLPLLVLLLLPCFTAV